MAKDLAHWTPTGPPKFVEINISGATGDQEVVAAVPGKAIRVLHYTMVPQGAGLPLRWNCPSFDLAGALNLGAMQPMSASSGDGLFETARGEALRIDLGLVAGSVGGHLTYVEVG